MNPREQLYVALANDYRDVKVKVTNAKERGSYVALRTETNKQLLKEEREEQKRASLAANAKAKRERKMQ